MTDTSKVPSPKDTISNNGESELAILYSFPWGEESVVEEISNKGDQYLRLLQDQGDIKVI